MCECKQKKGAVQAVIAFPVGQRVSKNTTYMCFGCGYWDRARCMCSPLHVCLCGKKTNQWLWPLLIWLLPYPAEICVPVSLSVSDLSAGLTDCEPVFQESCWRVKWQIGQQQLWRGRWKRAGREKGRQTEGERVREGVRQRAWVRQRQTKCKYTESVCVYIYTHSHRGRLSAEHTDPRGERQKRLLRRSDWQNAEEEKCVIWWIWMVCMRFHSMLTCV